MNRYSINGCCRGFILANLGHAHGHKAAEDQFEFNEMVLKVCGGLLGSNVYIAVTNFSQKKEKEFLKALGFISVKIGNLETHSAYGTDVDKILVEHIVEKRKRVEEEKKKQEEILKRRKFLKIIPKAKEINVTTIKNKTPDVYQGLVRERDIQDCVFGSDGRRFFGLEISRNIQNMYGVYVSALETEYPTWRLREVVYREVLKARKRQANQILANLSSIGVASNTSNGISSSTSWVTF